MTNSTTKPVWSFVVLSFWPFVVLSFWPSFSTCRIHLLVSVPMSFYRCRYRCTLSLPTYLPTSVLTYLTFLSFCHYLSTIFWFFSFVCPQFVTSRNVIMFLCTIVHVFLLTYTYMSLCRLSSCLLLVWKSARVSSWLSIPNVCLVAVPT